MEAHCNKEVHHTPLIEPPSSHGWVQGTLTMDRTKHMAMRRFATAVTLTLALMANANEVAVTEVMLRVRK